MRATIKIAKMLNSGYLYIKIHDILLENNKILLKTFACGADMRRKREKLEISAVRPQNLTF